MRNIIIAVIDLGLLKAYRIEHTRLKTPRLVLLEEFEPADAHGKLIDKLTDHAGRNRVPNSNISMSMGERQRVTLEFRKRLVKQLAEGLTRLLKNEAVDGCFMAASKEINHCIMEELTPRLRAKVLKNVRADLAKVRKSELLEHFES